MDEREQRILSYLNQLVVSKMPRRAFVGQFDFEERRFQQLRKELQMSEDQIIDEAVLILKRR